jgi:uncharacterized protein
VFRGVVFNLLLRAFPKTKGGITGAVVLGGVLFGLMHFSNMGAGVKFSSCLIQVISAGLMGVLFCMIYASTRNFWMLAIFHTVVDMGGLLSSGIFEGGGVADRINEFSAMNCIAFVVLGIPMLVMLRKSRRIRLEMLYNNVTIIDDEREGAKLAVVSLVLGICSIIFSFFGYLMGLGIVGMLASKMSKRAKQIIIRLFHARNQSQHFSAPLQGCNENKNCKNGKYYICRCRKVSQFLFHNFNLLICVLLSMKIFYSIYFDIASSG